MKLDQVLSSGAALIAGHLMVSWDRLPFVAAFACYAVLIGFAVGLTSDSQARAGQESAIESIRQLIAHFPRNRVTLAVVAFTAMAFEWVRS